MKIKFGKKLLCITLAFAMLIACIPMAANADTSEIRFGVVSDIHYIAPSLKSDSDAWNSFVYNKHKEYNELDSLVDNALDGVRRNAEGKETYLLIPGDMTKDGEFESHKALAAKLEKFEKDTGIQVFVVPGNHDVNNSNAVTYENGIKEPTEKTSPEQFRDIYKNLGYDLADSVFVPADGNKGGMLSYAVTLGGYRLIAIDSCIYSNDNGAENNEHETAGNISDDLLAWILDECEKAENQGLTVVGMQHHNLVPHMDIEEATFAPFLVNNWLQIAETYADAGMHYVFTGHLHANDTASHVSDSGETVYDILSPTLSGFPNYYKIADFKSDGKKTTLKTETIDIDEYKNVVSDDGTVHAKPFAYTYSYERSFGEGGVKSMIMGALEIFFNDIFTDIQKSGGVGEYLKSLNLDLEKIIVDALGTNGLALGPVEILTVSSNVMGLINDLFSQLDEIYVNQPELTMKKAEAIVDKVLNFRLSDKPATMLTDLLGYEVNPEGCTVAEFATTVMLSFYAGDENASKYAYVTEILDGFFSGELAEKLFALLLEVVADDLVQKEILANLRFNPGELFPKGTMFFVTGRLLQGTVEALLGGDNSFINLIDSVLSIPLVPEEYSSINSIIEHLLGEYITPSQYESWGYTINWMLSSFIIDENCNDKNATYTYSGAVVPVANKNNYRLPSHIVTNLGEDSSSEISITWLTKYSVTGTDIEILPYSENPGFTGNATTGNGIDCSYELVKKAYPGADIGLLLVLMPYERDYVKHTIKLSGLEPGQKYSYRVGDAEKGWWSEAGIIRTAEGGNEKFTFLYLTDPQAQRPEHYNRFANVVETAYAEHPDARFIVSAGDQVDMGGNIKHWNYLLNSTEKLLSVPLMPTTGNHEDKGAVITENFVLPGVPEQNLDSGVYYSYDYNNVHFTVLNTNDDEDDKLGEEQIKWLKNDIKSSDAKWKVVVLHKAIYSNGSHYDDGDVKGMRAQLSTLLPYLGVDLVLQGHDHVYLRTDAINANSVIPAKEETVSFDGLDYSLKYNPKGSIYSICGTSGIKVYQTKDVEATDELFPRAEKLNAENTENSMFSAITVEGDRLYYNAYEVENGEAIRIDNFAIEKTEDDSVSDKAGIFGNVIEALFESVDMTAFWKAANFFLSAIGKVMNLVWSVF